MKFGIKHRYPRIPLPVKLKGVVQLVRPFTLIPSFIAGCIGIILPLVHSGSWHLFANLKYVLLAAISLSLAQGFGQIMNQIVGWKEDMVNKKYRPIPSGILSTNEASIICMFFMILSCVLASYVPNFLGWICLFLFFAFLYNLYVKYKNHWLALIWLALSRGFFPIVATWSVFGSLLNPIPWGLGLIAFSWVLAYQGTKDYNDMKGDAKFNIPTLFTVYGVEGAVRRIISLSLLPILLSLILPLIGLLPINFILLISLSVIGMFINLDLVTGVGESKYFENSRPWVMFYIGLSMIYLLSLVALVII